MIHDILQITVTLEIVILYNELTLPQVKKYPFNKFYSNIRNFHIQINKTTTKTTIETMYTENHGKKLVF